MDKSSQLNPSKAGEIPHANRINSSSSAPRTRGKQSIRLWLRMLSCSTLVEQTVSTRLRDEFGVTLPQFDVLSELEHAAAPISMTELSRHLMVSKGNVTGLVDRLERDRLVERKASKDDRRVQFIGLSNKGEKLFDDMAQTHESWLREMFGDLSINDIEVMIELLRKTKESITNTKGLEANQ